MPHVVPQVGVGAMLEEGLEALWAADGGDVQRRSAVRPLCVDAQAAPRQELEDLRASWWH